MKNGCAIEKVFCLRFLKLQIYVESLGTAMHTMPMPCNVRDTKYCVSFYTLQYFSNLKSHLSYLNCIFDAQKIKYI